MKNEPKLRRVLEHDQLRAFFPEILSLSKRESDPLGFIPKSGMESAIDEGRLFAVVDEAANNTLAGYVLFGGVFPVAKIYQLAVAEAYRRKGVGSALLSALTAQLEERGYFSIAADIRDDLSNAINFYRKNGFEQVGERPGGKTRNRTILIHARELDTDTLFSGVHSNSAASLETSIHRVALRSDPRFALDINVYFDLAKRRKSATEAEALFRAGLSDMLKIGVAAEFVSELRKHAKPNKPDPILNLALCIPKLPAVEADELSRMSEKVHRLVFDESNSKSAGTAQAKSDANHIAHAALSQCTAFVTRDKELLRAREKLRIKVGIELISPRELFALLPDEGIGKGRSERGEGFVVDVCSSAELTEFLGELETTQWAYRQVHELAADMSVDKVAVRDAGRIEAVSLHRPPRNLGEYDLSALVCRPEEPRGQFYVEHLLDNLLRKISVRNPSVLRLLRIQGQSVVSAVARAKGFLRKDDQAFEKAVIGCPVSPANWEAKMDHLAARSGISLPRSHPTNGNSKLRIVTGGKSVEIAPQTLEDLLSPTLLWWPDRPCVIASIGRHYAEALLGAGQNERFAFIEDREAAFRRTRSFVSTPRNAKKMVPGSLMFFYESSNGGGRSAVVAVARIISSSIVTKELVGAEERKEIVVDDLDDFSSSNDVLLTRFEDLFLLEKPVSLADLRKMGAADGANFISAKCIESIQGRSILEKGFVE